jgi:hypothetical protein
MWILRTFLISWFIVTFCFSFCEAFLAMGLAGRDPLSLTLLESDILSGNAGLIKKLGFFIISFIEGLFTPVALICTIGLSSIVLVGKLIWKLSCNE